jgi:isopentenyl-diphosphate delta-isomerase
MQIEFKNSAVTLIFNSDGELLLQLRAANDGSYPSHWDFSAGGGIDPGENEKACAERELREELGIEAKVTFISKEHFQYPAWKSPALRRVNIWIYQTHHNGPFTIDPKEVEKVEFFKLKTIAKLIESGAKFHPEFALSWKKGIVLKASTRR